MFLLGKIILLGMTIFTVFSPAQMDDQSIIGTFDRRLADGGEWVGEENIVRPDDEISKRDDQFKELGIFLKSKGYLNIPFSTFKVYSWRYRYQWDLRGIDEKILLCFFKIHIGNEKYLVLRNYLPKDSSQTFLNGIQTGLGKSDPIKYFVRNLKSPISIMKEDRRK